tara:strand:+ start:47 stop:181 length:135 start_codon:yes stop_codon:yes gene_type:complete
MEVTVRGGHWNLNSDYLKVSDRGYVNVHQTTGSLYYGGRGVRTP